MSRALVAFTIEVDNTYEARAPHSTSKFGGRGPWLTSYGMWANLLRLVPADGISCRALARRAAYARAPHPAQTGMVRWRYITVGPDPSDGRAGIPKGDWIVRRTPAGALAAEHWEPLSVEVEDRWARRYGRRAVAELRRALQVIADGSDATLPGYLPQLDGNLRTTVPASDETVGGEPGLLTALANCLHLYAIEFETDFPVGLAVAANVLRVLDRDDVPLRDIERSAGISAVAVRWSLRALESEWAAQRPDPNAAHGKVARLSRKGSGLRDQYFDRARDVEVAWTHRHRRAVDTVRSRLAELTADPDVLRSGLVPPGPSWRPATPPEVLPDFPVVLYRGAFPDGA
jgi:hypothetical protein